MPDLRQLRAFVAVAEELNFTRAAERLFIAQQAVSKSVAQLERELGVELLERTTREVRLTAAGTALLAAGRDAIAAADAAFERARAVGLGLTGTVRVGATPAVGPSAREEAAAVLRDGAPDLGVSFHEVRPAEIGPLLRDRALDLVLARTAPRAAAPDVDSAALRPQPATLIVPAGHALATATKPVALAQLDGERLLTWSPPGTPYTDLLLSRLAAAGAAVEPVESRVTGGGEPPDLRTLDAIALMPPGWPPGSGNVPVQLEEEISLPLLVLWLAGARSPAVRRLLAGMSAQARAAPGVPPVQRL